MLAVPYAKVVRGYSFFGLSFVYVIFEDGTDIYFTSDGTITLPFARVSYDSGTGALGAWVKMDLTGANQVFYMHYGDGDVAEKSTASSVWPDCIKRSICSR